MSIGIPSGLPVLGGGAHDGPEDGACFMEYVGLLAGEPWGDNPDCVADALVNIMQNLNDQLTDKNRHYLAPLLIRTIGLGTKPRYRTEEDYRAYVNLGVDERAASNQRYITENTDLSQEAIHIFAEKMGFHHENIGRGCEADWFGERLSEVLDIAERADWQSSEEMGQLCYTWAEKLHESYEEAMAELGWERPAEQVCTIPEANKVLADAQANA